jgi:PEP-CTERM motif
MKRVASDREYVPGQKYLRIVRWMAAALLSAVAAVAPAAAQFDVTQSSQYLLIATEVGGQTTEVSVSNFELGANKAPVPSTDNFLNGGSTGGPTLAGAVPNLPANAAPVGQGIGGQGNIAVIDPQGEFNLQNTGVYGDPSIGIRVAGTASGSPLGSNINKSSNSFFNDPNQFPNTFNTGTQTGNTVSAASAVQSTRIDAAGTPGNAGVTFGFNHTALVAELALAQTAINGFLATGVLDTSPGGGVLTNQTTLSGPATIAFAGPNSEGGIDATITVPFGLNVIDIDTGGSDFSLQQLNLVINGPAGAFVIFRLPDNNNMLISNSNVLAGNGGIGENAILFYTDQNQNDTNFNFNNTIINGAAFWALGPGTISINDAQGCTQLIADSMTLNDVRFDRCAFIPEPSTAALLGVGLGGFLAFRRRRC